MTPRLHVRPKPITAPVTAAGLGSFRSLLGLVLGSLGVLASGAAARPGVGEGAASDPAAGQSAYLKASNTQPLDGFGTVVAVSGDTVAVGADGEDSGAVGLGGDQTDNSAAQSGAAYVFVEGASGWSQQAYLKASNTDAEDGFGHDLDLSGDTLVVGALAESSASPGVGGDEADDSLPGAGAAYVFVREAGSWGQQAYLKASNPSEADFFGQAVAISGDTIVVGAPGEDSSATGVDGDQNDDGPDFSGAAYVFVRDGETWSQQAYLKASNPDFFDLFGMRVAISGDTIAVSAYNEASMDSGIDGDQADDSALSAGAVYVFVRDGETWTQQAYIKASNAEAGDRFGISVALSGETLVVGADGEDGASAGVGGDLASNAAANAGAAYVFVRDGSSWTQQAYLKASNPESVDLFGEVVTVSGDVLAVGTTKEDGDATGLNGPDGNLGIQSGAAYVFTRDAGTWSQLYYVKASNTGVNDQFGAAVDLSGTSFVVGAVGESSSAAMVDGDQSDDSAFSAGAGYVFDLDAWTDQGCALAGVTGEPVLVAEGVLAPGTRSAVRLSNAAPGATGVLLLSFSSSAVPFKGGTLKPWPVVASSSVMTDGAGEVALRLVTPSDVSSGSQIWLQWAIQDAAAVFGVSLSNALLGVAP